ncbi:lysylphosphatidylglycerol synthase transmembrane domain-containing protein [Mycoplasma sp. 'Moose RK']|uniref:lysylphosphatidylglycerol synthase transmembrane domain-containing protein n=1 Tax=Mycoplasma sp. 'Moose RK' TaxID=2780095 RepID=UPI0018C2D36B|nr:lysylphosphatidylglycerol synthase transmembrane domain-containing protein [Mycoplasma sp. 'Moose RK']MBG0730947.1 flippase-like domain-containing protein [Mycoplasma sp. 'Moose RK']
MKSIAINPKEFVENENFISFNYELPLEISNSKIIGFISNKPNFINESYIFSLASAISGFLKQKKMTKILINHSSNNFGIAFSSIFFDILNSGNERQILIFDSKCGYSQSLARHYFINNDFDFLIDIEVNWTTKNSNMVKISFFKEKMKFLNFEEEKFINRTEKNYLFYRKTSLNKSNKFPIDWKNIIEFQRYLNLDLQNLTNSYQFYDRDSWFLTSFIENNFDTKSIKFLPVKNIFPIQKIIKKVGDNSVIWKKIITGAKFKTDFIFWLKKNKIRVALRKKLNFNIIKEKDLQLLFLDFLRSNWQNGKYFLISNQTDKYIVDFVQKNFSAKIFNYCEFKQMPETEIIKIREETNEEIILINSENVFFIPKSSEFMKYFGINTSFQALWYLKIFEYYKEKNLDIFQIISSLKSEVDFIFHHKFKLSISPNSFDKLVNLLVSEKDEEFRPQSFNIKNLDFDNRLIMIKVNLQKNDSYILTYFKPKQELTLFTSFSAKNHTHKQAIFRENTLISKLKLVNKDVIATKTSQKTNILKFSIFITTIIVILIILFYNFYNSSFADGSTTQIFVKFYDFFFKNKLHRLVFIGSLAFFLFWTISSAFQLKKIFNHQGIKTKFRHLFIGSFIATFMQFSTPFSFGGEVSYYWYFQRKQYPLKNISATLTYNALIHQVFNLIVSFIFVPVALIFYKDLFVFDSWEKIVFFIWLTVNIFLNLLVLLIIIVISIWKRLQYFLIRIFVGILNLNFFKKIEDKERLEFKFQFLIDNFKNHFLQVLANKRLLAQILILYKLPLFLLNFSFIILIVTMESAGFSLKSVNFFEYLKFISGFTILQISNNLSPTPGGVGSADVITKLIFEEYFREKSSANLDIFNFANRIFTWFLPYVISAIGIFTVWVGEKRMDLYKEIRQTTETNLILNHQRQKQYSNFYRYALLFWGIIAISVIIFVFVH